MKQKNKIVEVYGIWFLDLVSILVSFIVGTYIRFGNFRDMGDRNVHFLVCLCLMLFCTIYSFFFDWNRNFLKRNIWKEGIAVFQYNAIMLLVVNLLMTMMKWADVFSRLVLLYFFILNIILSLVIHLSVKKTMYTYYSSEQNSIKVMVVTQGNLIDETLDRLEQDLDIYYQIVALACLDYNMEGKKIRDIPVVAGKGLPHRLQMGYPAVQILQLLPKKLFHAGGGAVFHKSLNFANRDVQLPQQQDGFKNRALVIAVIPVPVFGLDKRWAEQADFVVPHQRLLVDSVEGRKLPDGQQLSFFLHFFKLPP